MDVREAVRIAREFVNELYADEEISFVGVEEIEFEEAKDSWYVTIGFFRPWARNETTLGGAIAGATGFDAERRSFKRVEVDSSGEVLAVRNYALHATV